MLNTHGFGYPSWSIIQLVSDVLFEEGRGIFRKKLPQTPNKEYRERMAAMQSADSQITENKSK